MVKRGPFRTFEPQKAALRHYPPPERLAPGPGLPMRGSLAVFQSNVSLAPASAVMDGDYATPTPQLALGATGVPW